MTNVIWDQTAIGWLASNNIGYLGLDKMIVRFVSLPLKSIDKIDADMLFQEIASSSDVSQDEWWLSWDFNKCESGVEGLVFGLHESMRKSIMSDEKWKDARCITIDAYERLNTYKNAGSPSLVIDQDSEGVCFGYYDGKTWRGIRRLHSSGNELLFWREFWHTSLAMGFKPGGVVSGRISKGLMAMFSGLYAIDWQGNVLPELPTSHDAYLTCEIPQESILNLRHGSWAVTRGWINLKSAKNVAVAACALLVVGLTATIINAHRLNNIADSATARIEAAFHEGLPNEPAMIDPLAQLRRAAGANHGSSDIEVLSVLHAISQTYNDVSWKVISLELRDGVFYMKGEAADIKSLNKIQSTLSNYQSKEVHINDTDITGNKVVFNMQWAGEKD